MTRLVLVDDNDIVRTGLRMILENALGLEVMLVQGRGAQRRLARFPANRKTGVRPVFLWVDIAVATVIAPKNAGFLRLTF